MKLIIYSVTCRLFLGICEGSITAGYLILVSIVRNYVVLSWSIQTTMFYTHAEATRRVGYWFLMNGTAQIFSGFVSFGTWHLESDAIHPWQLYMIICGLITFVVGICFWFFIPDNPMKARFLTQEEKIIAIERLKGQSSGVENKTWKKDQYVLPWTDSQATQ